ncbi:ABC transporter ATP-binding protein [Colwellia sp. KU-HH00111]|uniref:ABC transporter ATP-binding protein n=1 Tax=Colwellia sp. KU-HH00111 TaxID=3127652 RepID=UPI00310A0CCB
MSEVNVAIEEKHYLNNHNPVLGQLKFNVKNGEFVAIIGPSGCGKTTLLNMISGLESSVEQQITYGDTSDNEKHKPHLGYIFQQPRLMPWLTVRENIELVLPTSQHYGIAELLAQVGLANQGEYYPRQLSGGMQRRVSIARAFATNPKLLLLDEPFNSLDAPTANRLRLLLIDLCKQRGTTVIFVTHDLSEAIYLADRILFMSNPPSTVIHQTLVKLPRPRKESGALELAWQAQLMTRFPGLLAGKID